MMAEKRFQFSFCFLLVSAQAHAHDEDARKSAARLYRCEINPKSHARFDGAVKVSHPFHLIRNDDVAVTARLELLLFWRRRIGSDNQLGRNGIPNLKDGGVLTLVANEDKSVGQEICL